MKILSIGGVENVTASQSILKESKIGVAKEATSDKVKEKKEYKM